MYRDPTSNVNKDHADSLGKFLKRKVSSQDCLDMAGVAMMELNRSGQIVAMNDAGLDLLGYSTEASLLGRDWFDLFLPAESLERARQTFSEMISGVGKAPETMRADIVPCTDERRTIRWQCEPVKDQAGTIIGMLSTAHDVTEQAAAEQELARTRRELEIDNLLARAFLGAEDDAVFGEIAGILTSSLAASFGMVLWQCPASSRWTGYSVQQQEDGEYQLDDRLLEFDSETLAAKPWGSALNTTGLQVVRGESVPVGRSSGFVQTVMAVGLRHGHGIIGLLVLGGSDEWGDEAVAQQLSRHAGQVAPMLYMRLQQLSQEAQRQNLEAQLRYSQKMEAIGELAGGIAHDFNNVLQIIMGNVQLAKMKVDDPEACTVKLDQIEDASNRAANLVRQILAFSRRQVLRLERQDMSELIHSVAEMLRRVIGEQVMLTVDCTVDPLPVRIDREQLEQVLLNLCINARDAMPDGGSLDISTERLRGEVFPKRDLDGFEAKPGQDYARVLVKDSGFGMSTDVCEHAFEPFFTTKQFGSGTGLGLSMAYGIMRQHGGSISVSSRPGKGSTFRLYLPLEAAGQPASPVSLQPGPKTVLVVEDDPGVCLLAREILERDYKTLKASDGEEAVKVFEEHQEEIDLVFMDVVLPKLGGKQAARRIMQKRPDIAIVMTSGYSPRLIEDELRDNPNQVFLQKPYVAEDLLAIVGEMLGQDRQPT